MIDSDASTHEECEITQQEELEWRKNEVTSDLYKEPAGNVISPNMRSRALSLKRV